MQGKTHVPGPHCEKCCSILDRLDRWGGHRTGIVFAGEGCYNIFNLADRLKFGGIIYVKVFIGGLHRFLAWTAQA